MSQRKTDRLMPPASEEARRRQGFASATIKMIVLAIIALPIIGVLVFVAATLIGQGGGHHEAI